MSFNNRIYFREHQPPEHGDSAYLTVSDRVRTTALSPHCFAIPEPQPQTPTADNFQLCTISQTVELDKSKGDDTSINWSLVSRISRYSFPLQLLSYTDVSDWPGSLSSPTLGNTICFLTTPSVRSTCFPPLMTDRTRWIDYDEKWVWPLQWNLPLVATFDVTFDRVGSRDRPAELCVAPIQHWVHHASVYSHIDC